MKIVNYLCLCLVLLSNVCCAQKTQPISTTQNSETPVPLFISELTDNNYEAICAALGELNCNCLNPKSNSCEECLTNGGYSCEPSDWPSKFKFFLVNPPKGQNCLPDGTCTMPVIASIVPFVNTKLNDKAIIQEKKQIKKTTIYLTSLKLNANGVFPFKLGKNKQEYQINFKNGLFDISTLKLTKK